MLGGAALGAGLVGLEADRVLSSGSGNNKSVATGPSNVPQYVPLQEAGTPGPSAAKEIRKEPNTLREWADSAGIEIGTDLGYLNIMSSLKAKEFNSAVLAYDMAWTNLEPEKGNTQYRNSSKSAYADQNINYAINKK